MQTVLFFVGVAITAAYFIGFGIVLAMGLIDQQKDSTLDNKVVILILAIPLLIVPAFGIISYLTHQ